MQYSNSNVTYFGIMVTAMNSSSGRGWYLYLWYVFFFFGDDAGWCKLIAPNSFRVEYPRRFWEIKPWKIAHLCFPCWTVNLSFFLPDIWVFVFFGIFGSYHRPTIMVPENKTVFQHFGRPFLLGTFKNVPYRLNELIIGIGQFSRGIYFNIGIGRFCRLEVPTDSQLAQFRFFYRNRVNCTKQAACLVGPVSIKNRNWASWPSVRIRACKIGQPQ